METIHSKTILLVDHDPLHRKAIKALADKHSIILVISSLNEGTGRSESPSLILFCMDGNPRCSHWALKEFLDHYPRVQALCYSRKSCMNAGFLHEYGDRLVIVNILDVFTCLERVFSSLEHGVIFQREHLLVPEYCQNSVQMRKLSSRELEVFCLLGKGLGLIEVATELSLSKNTVNSHIKGILRKLALPGSAEVRRLATDYVRSSHCRTLAVYDGYKCPECADSIGRCPVR